MLEVVLLKAKARSSRILRKNRLSIRNQCAAAEESVRSALHLCLRVKWSNTKGRCTVRLALKSCAPKLSVARPPIRIDQKKKAAFEPPFSTLNVFVRLQIF